MICIVSVSKDVHWSCVMNLRPDKDLADLLDFSAVVSFIKMFRDQVPI